MMQKFQGESSISNRIGYNAAKIGNLESNNPRASRGNYEMLSTKQIAVEVKTGSQNDGNKVHLK